MHYRNRNLGGVVKKAMRTFPAVVVTGPRQSGKTTLLKHLSKETHAYLSLEDPDIRAQVKSDPRGFLSLHPPPLFLDEVQYVPEILPYIKSAIDERRKPGQWLLSGSQHFPLMAGVSESLAGRAAVLSLLPLAWGELNGSPPATLERNASDILRGFYPELWGNPTVDTHLWHASYIQTYLERDVRAITQVENLSTFEQFLKLLAGRTGQILNLAEVGREAGITQPTARRWVSILETSGQIFLLPTYHKNFGKRIIKSPKLYFLDTGIAASLIGLQDPRVLLEGPFWGPLFETFLVSEWVKLFRHSGRLTPLYYWRDSNGDEIDLLVDFEGVLHPFEIKATATPAPGHATTLLKWKTWAGAAALPGTLLCNASQATAVGPGILAKPWFQGISEWAGKYL